MRLIDADELIEGRVENDPVFIAANCAPTACDLEKIEKQLKNLADKANDKILETAELQLYYDGYEDGIRAAIEIARWWGK